VDKMTTKRRIVWSADANELQVLHSGGAIQAQVVLRTAPIPGGYPDVLLTVEEEIVHELAELGAASLLRQQLAQVLERITACRQWAAEAEAQLQAARAKRDSIALLDADGLAAQIEIIDAEISALAMKKEFCERAALALAEHAAKLQAAVLQEWERAVRKAWKRRADGARAWKESMLEHLVAVVVDDLNSVVHADAIARAISEADPFARDAILKTRPAT
jgi:hypothetical protein